MISYTVSWYNFIVKSCHCILLLNILIICNLWIQTDEERQQALQSFSAQSTFSSSGSGSSLGPVPSPTSHPEPRPKVRKAPRKNQNDKYRLKNIHLRKAARTMIFVGIFCLMQTLTCIFIQSYHGKPIYWCFFLLRKMQHYMMKLLT